MRTPKIVALFVFLFILIVPLHADPDWTKAATVLFSLTVSVIAFIGLIYALIYGFSKRSTQKSTVRFFLVLDVLMLLFLGYTWFDEWIYANGLIIPTLLFLLSLSLYIIGKNRQT